MTKFFIRLDACCFVLLLSDVFFLHPAPGHAELHPVRHRRGFDSALLPAGKEGVFTADFEQENGTVTSVRDGTPAALDCKVYLRHNKTVSWLRHRLGTLELLTVGDATYSGDARFNISYVYPNNWRLHISSVQKDDIGAYICQISSFPPKVLVTTLQVRDALVELLDSDGKSMQTQFYNPGSEIELTCVVRSRASWSTEVSWLKDGAQLDINHRPAVSIGTQVEAHHVLSRLWIGGASRFDTGNYTCSIPGRNADEFPRASIRVHVLDGEFHAAVHGGAWGEKRSSLRTFLHIYALAHLVV